MGLVKCGGKFSTSVSSCRVLPARPCIVIGRDLSKIYLSRNVVVLTSLFTNYSLIRLQFEISNSAVVKFLYMIFHKNLIYFLPWKPGDSVAIVKSLHQKYRPDTMSEFFQTLQQATEERHRKDKRNWIQRKYGSRIKRAKIQNIGYNPRLHRVVNGWNWFWC